MNLKSSTVYTLCSHHSEQIMFISLDNSLVLPRNKYNTQDKFEYPPRAEIKQEIIFHTWK